MTSPASTQEARQVGRSRFRLDDIGSNDNLEPEQQ